ncbi:CRAL-TRIO domain-containing protein [Dactylonectria macrodidyma]|uniref:CRAL-TRIO domain-containing protein n=1 Tax=Dactylonectria macrodidyma TaxID=307937 RepID=A0A9P9ETN3_9HYPO|nr:CRAL-TRIO domain-containing protein [Dactylonectria macrodidyma]
MTADHDATLTPTTSAAYRVKSSASTVTEYGYPRCHLGYLTQPEEEAFLRFKDVLVERGLLKKGPPASHDDPLLLRYLRARRWNVEHAFQQFKDTEEWRVANDIEVLYSTIELDAYEQSRRLYPQWTGRRDRRGIPLYVFEIRTLDAKSVAEYEKVGASNTFSKAKSDGKTPAGLLRLFALYENLTRFNMPFCTQLPDREFPEVPITMSTNIVDVSGVGLKQFWNLKAHMQVASQLATAHYPETLDRIFVIGAPFFFSTVWGWIKRWFDPITVSKIFILGSHEVKSTLENFIDIRNIPKKYGGQLDYKFGQLAIPDESWNGVVAWENGHKTFPSGPLLWQEIDDGKRLACVALGAKGGNLRNERVCTIPKTFELPVLEREVVLKTNGVATETAEGTQTTDSDTRDDGVQTDDTLLSDEVQEKLKINVEDKGKGIATVPATAQTVTV